jgi:hypothetical protein
MLVVLFVQWQAAITATLDFRINESLLALIRHRGLLTAAVRV